MTYLPARRKRPRMMERKPDAPIRCPSHLKWVRGHNCCCVESDPTGCEGRIEAAHVRVGTDGGIGSKPSDSYAVPLCSAHHRQQHSIGERSFDRTHKFVLGDIARHLWKISPHRIAWERKQQTESP